MSTQNFGLIKALFVQSTPPSNTNVLWRDTTVNRTKEYDPTVPGWVALNANVGTVNWGSIGGVLSNQTDLNNELTSLQGSINTNLSSIGTINTTLASVQGNITTIQGQIVTLQGQVHTQGTDQGLDTGGSNAVTAAEIRTFIDSKAQVSGLASLDSAGKIPLTQIPDSIRTSLQFQGMWNASSNTPTLATGVGTQGHFYIVSTAGGTDLDGETDWDTGDWAIFDGTTWSKVDNSERVTQVNGQVGNVTLTTSNINEGTNLYYTEVRVNANTNVAANTLARHNRNEDQFTLPSIATEAQLRAIVTPSLAFGSHISYRGSVSGELFVYVLEAGTDADDSPNLVRPDDYSDTTNERVWRRALVGTVAGGIQTAENGLTGDGVRVILGGALIQDTSISGAQNFNLVGLTSFNATGITGGINLLANVGATMNFQVNGAYGMNLATGLVTDFGANPSGLAYASDYSANQSDRNLVDRGTVRGYLNGFLSGSLSAFASVNVGAGGFSFTSTGQSLSFSPTALTVGDVANAVIQSDQALRIQTGSGGNLEIHGDGTGMLESVQALTLQTTANNVGPSSNLNIITGNSTGTTTDSGNISLTTGTATGTRGSVIIQGLTYPIADGTAGQSLTTNGSGVLSFTTIAGGITNGAANNELAKSDGTNLIASGLFVTSLAGAINIDSNDIDFRLRSGSTSSATPRNLFLTTVPTTGIGTSGNVSITTGSSTGVGNNSGNITIQVGTGTSGASTGTITIGDVNRTLILNGLTFPISDGTAGQVLSTNGSGVLSFSSVAGGITNSAAANELVKSDGTNIVGIGVNSTSDGLISRTGALTIRSTMSTSIIPDGILQLGTVNSSTGNTSDTFIDTGDATGVNGNSGDISIATGTATGSRGSVSIQGLVWPQSDGTGGQALVTNGSGVLSFATISGGGGDPRPARATVTPSATLDLSTAITQAWTLTSAVTVTTISNLVNNQETLIDKRGNFPLTINTTNFPNARITGFPQSNDQDILIRIVDATNNIFRVAYLDSDLFLGTFTTLANLQTAFAVAPIPGAYAHVDAGAGTDLIVYAYDTDDGWVQVGSTGGTPRGAGNGLTLNGNDLDLGDASLSANVSLTPDSTLTRSIFLGSSSNLLLQHRIDTRVLTVSSNGPTVGQTRALVVDGNGINIGIANSASDLSINLDHTTGMVVVDNILNRGIIGNVDFSSNSQNFDYIQKIYADARITGNATSSILQTPTGTQNGFSVTWDNANSQFTLSNVSGGAGITNGAANNELPKSDGTNLVSSGLLSSSVGNLQLGLSGTGGNTRTISTSGSLSAINLALAPNGVGALVQFSFDGTGLPTHNLSASTFDINNATSFNLFNSGSLILGSEPSQIAGVTGPVTLSSSGSTNNNTGSVTITSGDALTNGTTGNVVINTGNSTSGTKGSIIINGLTWPTGDGSANQVLTTNGGGVLSFTTVAGGGITNGAANNELPLSDGTNLVGSGVDVITSGATKVINTLSDSMILRAGDSTSTSTRSISIQTTSTLNSNGSGDVSITTGNVTGGGNQSGDINITPGIGSSGGNSGDVNITLAPKPSGSFGHLKVSNLPDQSQISGIPANIIYDQGGFLRVTGSEITPSARITALTSATNATSMNFASDSGFKEFSLSLGEDTTVSFSNGTNRSFYLIYLTITGATRTITLPASAVMTDSTNNITGAVWTAAANTLQLDAGTYELAGNFDGTNDYFKLAGPYA